MSKLQVGIKEDMGAPVYVYFILHDFYQNHKRYVRSVNYDQLHGKEPSSSALDVCKPQRRLPEEWQNATGVVHEGQINPCGLTAFSWFNDTIDNFEVRMYILKLHSLSSACACCDCHNCFACVYRSVGAAPSGAFRLISIHRLVLLRGLRFVIASAGHLQLRCTTSACLRSTHALLLIAHAWCRLHATMTSRCTSHSPWTSPTLCGRATGRRSSATTLRTT